MSGTIGLQQKLTRILCAVVACAIVSFSMGRASADTIEIYFTGIDIAYDGSTITDSDPGGNDPDPIINASIVISGSPFGTFSTDVTADLLIENVNLLVNQVVMGGSTNSYFTLTFEDGTDADSDPDFLTLTLEEVMVTYLDNSPKDFVFSASVASGFTSSDSLPFDIHGLIANPITLSFSAQTSNPVIGQGGIVESFNASGSGEIRGELDPDGNQVIPEPGSIGMMVLASLMGGVYVMRRRLG